MIHDKKLVFLESIDGYDYYRYDPTFGKWFYKDYEKISLRSWIRFFLEYITRKYCVYYMVKEDIILGYCVVSSGTWRLKCVTKNDIVCGPYYILPQYRGYRYSRVLIDNIINRLHTNYNYVFDYIKKAIFLLFVLLKRAVLKNVGS